MTDATEKLYEQFKIMREQRHLTVAQVANVLHLTIPIIEQIEAGNFVHQRLAPVFMRGYVRAYAKYLNLPDDMTDKIMGELVINPPVQRVSEKIVAPVIKNKVIINGKKLSLYIAVVLILAVLGIFWSRTHQAPVESKQTMTPIETTAPVEPTVAPALPTEEPSAPEMQIEASPEVAEPVAPITEEQPNPSSTEEVATAPPPAKTQNTTKTNNSSSKVPVENAEETP